MTERQFRKRANGDGSRPRQRKDGRWQAFVTVQSPDGRKRLYFYGRTAREVTKQRDLALNRRGHGLPAVDDRRPFGEYLQSFLTGLTPSLAPNSVKTYGVAAQHLVGVFGEVALASIRPEAIQRYYAARIDAGAAPKSIQLEHLVLRRSLEQAVRWGYLARNPAEGISPPRVLRKEGLILTPAATQRFLEAAHGDELEALWVLAITTGMRQGELLGLQWGDIEPDTGEIAVRRHVTAFGIGDTKTHRPRRVQLVRPAVDALSRRWLAAGQPPREAWIFPAADGGPLSRSTPPRALARLLAAAELPPVTFHALRHSCATLLLSLGVPAKVVAEMLGHSVIMTLQTYSHVIPTIQRQATDALDDFFAGAVGVAVGVKPSEKAAG